MEKSYTNLNFPISAPKSMYEGSFTSFEHLTNTQKKINFYRSSNLSINSDNLSNEKKINKEKEKKINHYRNSTLGFINNSKLCQKKLNTDEFQVNINDPPNIIEEPHQTFFKMKIKSRKNSELEKNTKIKSVLQNKELKKKEVQLYKLLQSKFHSAEHKYLQTISKLQINYSDATAYNTIYYPSKKNINTTSLTPRINNQNNQISILSPLNRKNSWTSPYRLTTNAFFCNSNFKAIRKIGIEKK